MKYLRKIAIALSFVAGMVSFVASANAAEGEVPYPFIVVQDGKIGFISPEDGSLLAAPRYKLCANWSEGFAWVQEEVGQSSIGTFIGADAKPITSRSLRDLSGVFPERPVPEFRNGIAVVSLPDGGFGYLNTNGALIGQTSRTGAFMRQDDKLLITVGDGGAIGFIDRAGVELISPRFAEATPFRGGRASVRYDEKWGLIDETGGWVAHPEFDAVRWFADEHRFWAYRLDGKWGVLDRDGKRLTDAVYDLPGVWSGDSLSVCTSNLWGLVAIDGSTLVAPRYQMLEPLRGETLWAAQCTNGLWGIITANGEIKAECRYCGVSSPAEGVYTAWEEGLIGLLDIETGEFINYERYTRILPMELPLEKFAKIEKHGLWGVVDLNSGKEILKPSHDSVVQHKDVFQAINGDSKWFNASGMQIEVPPGFGKYSAKLMHEKNGESEHGQLHNVKREYDEVGKLWSGFVPVKRDGLWGLVKEGGEVVLPCEYEGLEWGVGEDDGSEIYGISSGQIIGLTFYGRGGRP